MTDRSDMDGLMADIGREAEVLGPEGVSQLNAYRDQLRAEVVRCHAHGQPLPCATCNMTRTLWGGCAAILRAVTRPKPARGPRL